MFDRSARYEKIDVVLQGCKLMDRETNQLMMLNGTCLDGRGNVMDTIKLDLHLDRQTEGDAKVGYRDREIRLTSCH